MDFVTLIIWCKIESIEETIGKKIIGQKGPVRSVASAIRLRDHGWINPDRPLVMLFLGSSGVGKTEVAKQVALYLSNRDAAASGSKLKNIREVEDAKEFIRIDMSEYQHSHTVSNLFGTRRIVLLFVCYLAFFKLMICLGSPKGYVVSDRHGAAAWSYT